MSNAVWERPVQTWNDVALARVIAMHWCVCWPDEIEQFQQDLSKPCTHAFDQRSCKELLFAVLAMSGLLPLAEGR